MAVTQGQEVAMQVPVLRAYIWSESQKHLHTRLEQYESHRHQRRHFKVTFPHVLSKGYRKEVVQSFKLMVGCAIGPHFCRLDPPILLIIGLSSLALPSLIAIDKHRRWPITSQFGPEFSHFMVKGLLTHADVKHACKHACIWHGWTHAHKETHTHAHADTHTHTHTHTHTQ